MVSFVTANEEDLMAPTLDLADYSCTRVSVEALIEDVNEGDITCLRNDGEGIWIDNLKKETNEAIIDMKNEGADDVYQFTPSQNSQGERKYKKKPRRTTQMKELII
ncbi:hypothetical protein PanWU01x14_223500 [Parasponia andersonii]|uniref:Uncharacterized protein n=1 Tax=Parasponia andersonii TaxID=3476 RepID=A0A2P5BNK0_PARAD|nr:hypothetical protein PanWU01x14_223500 [Parasponia andersonii]